MVWSICSFLTGLLLGGGVAYKWHLRKTRLAAIEITNLELQVNELKEFNSYCLSHAAGVLLTWEDFKEGHGID